MTLDKIRKMVENSWFPEQCVAIDSRVPVGVATRWTLVQSSRSLECRQATQCFSLSSIFIPSRFITRERAHPHLPHTVPFVFSFYLYLLDIYTYIYIHITHTHTYIYIPHFTIYPHPIYLCSPTQPLGCYYFNKYTRYHMPGSNIGARCELEKIAR